MNERDVSGKSGVGDAGDVDFAYSFLETIKLQEAIGRMDDRELLWRMMKSRIWEQPIGSVEDELLQELATRLYPEFDGETTTFEEFGWRTQRGDIVYSSDHFTPIENRHNHWVNTQVVVSIAPPEGDRHEEGTKQALKISPLSVSPSDKEPGESDTRPGDA